MAPGTRPLEQHQSALFQGPCRSRNQSGTQASTEARAADVRRTGAKDRLEESETLQQQAQNNSLSQFSASPDLQTEFVGGVIGAMESHTDLSTQILNNPELKEKLLGELVPLIYNRMKATA